MGVKHERHLEHFPRGTPDQDWLPMVGQKKWALLTADKRIRYNILEKKALAECGVKEFVFASGNLSGEEMAVALERALPKMVRMAGRTEPPFVAAITRLGEVHLRWPK
jgi:PIN domain-containing protein